MPRLHVVTDDEILARPGFEGEGREVLEAGGPAVALHLRSRRATGARLFELARGLRRSGTLVVNDRVDVAMASGAAGAQLGSGSLPTPEARRLLGAAALVGVSTHAVDEAGRAEAEGADWIFAGTIWATPSHPGRPGRGVGAIREAAAATRLPVLAIGGVTLERTAEVMEAGGWGVAVIRGVWDAPDPGAAVESYLGVLEGSTG